MRHITLSEYLRPWAKVGISHFLLDVSSSHPDFLGTENEPIQEAFLEQPTTLEPSSNRVFARHVKGKREENPCMSESLLQKENTHNFSAQADLTKTTTFSFLEQHSYLTPSDLPSHWQTLLAKIPQAPVVWTYNELGYDLLYKSSKERSLCLRSIIGKLSLPKGSSSFLPYSLPLNDKGLDENIDAFYFGLTQILPKVIIFLGEDASKKVAPSLDLAVIFKQRVHGGKLFIQLPSLSALASNNTLFDSACSYLRSVLVFLSPR